MHPQQFGDVIIMQTGKPAPSFSERLHDMQTISQEDLDEIRLFLEEIYTWYQDAKHQKKQWHTLAVIEHTTGISFGLFAMWDIHQDKIALGLFLACLMIINATIGFKAGKQASEWAKYTKQVQQYHAEMTELVVKYSTCAENIKFIAACFREVRTRQNQN